MRIVRMKMGSIFRPDLLDIHAGVREPVQFHRTTGEQQRHQESAAAETENPLFRRRQEGVPPASSAPLGQESNGISAVPQARSLDGRELIDSPRQQDAGPEQLAGDRHTLDSDTEPRLIIRPLLSQAAFRTTPSLLKWITANCP